jgi:putative acyl-CoA dehydrogenase
VAAVWEPRILRRAYDPSFRPAERKSGVTVGMAMTEKQGGSDVRANTTRAERSGDGGYRITGHKWFCSAPMCDAFLVLAQAPGGLTCFLLPRWTPDGEKNGLLFQRLKNKLGNRANASSEVEFENAWALRIGEEGRGVATIIEMVTLTRLDCVIGAAGLMRHALTLARHHVEHRAAFGKRLIEQPLMRAVVAELAVEWEAAALLMLRLAEAFDRRERDPAERAFARLGAAVAKYWVGKRAPAMVTEALECLGGAGYVEESGMPRLYREAPLLSIWEGSGNVIALDILRAWRKEPEAMEALRAEIRAGGVRTDAIDALLARGVEERDARRLGELLATGLQASLAQRHAPEAVAAAYRAARMAGEGGWTFGTLPRGCDVDGILERRGVPAAAR